MRILLVTNMYPPHHLGGYELSCRDVVERFRRRGHDVTVLTTTFRVDGVDGVRVPDDASVLRHLDFYWRAHGPWTPRGARVLSLERGNIRVLRRTIDSVRPEVLSLWNMGAIPLSLVTAAIDSGLPIVHHTCNDWPALNLELDPFRALLARRPTSARLAARLFGVPTELPDIGAHGTFCWVSKATWDRAEARTPWRFPQSTVVHSGISHDDFPPVEPPAEATAWHGNLLFAGRIDGLKGVETVIEAATLLPDVRVTFLGPGDPDYIDALRARAERLGIGTRITFGTTTRDRLREAYLAADAFLFTSLHEPFGLVPIEAMACGTPVIASGVGGSSEFLVDGGNCVLYEPGNADSLAAAITRLAGDPELRLHLAVHGLATANEFSVDRLADRLERAHLDAVGEPATPA